VPSEMMERFVGESGNRRLIDALKNQKLICHDLALAQEFANISEIVEIGAGKPLITQGDADNHLYFILSGKFSVLVNGRQVAVRSAGEHLGEMAIIDPASKRSASVVASEASLVARVDENRFSALADTQPKLWRAVALGLSHRLDERRKFHDQPNEKPVLFVGSSSEQLDIAKAVAAVIPADVAAVTIWSTGVFEASSFPVDDLEAQLQAADFALLIGGADDKIISRGVESSAPRDNVIFELGLFMGALSRSRTYLLVPKGQELKIPSDILGIGKIYLDQNPTKFHDSLAEVSKQLTAIISKRGPK
jgi:CRP/FNR family cyclic AMP-dependent transcriptional regulator